MSRTTNRWTLAKMEKKYLQLQKQNFEQVIITEVLNDIHRIRVEKFIPVEDL